MINLSRTAHVPQMSEHYMRLLLVTEIRRIKQDKSSFIGLLSGHDGPPRALGPTYSGQILYQRFDFD